MSPSKNTILYFSYDLSKSEVICCLPVLIRHIIFFPSVLSVTFIYYNYQNFKFESLLQKNLFVNSPGWKISIALGFNRVKFDLEIFSLLSKYDGVSLGVQKVVHILLCTNDTDSNHGIGVDEKEFNIYYKFDLYLDCH